MQVVRSHGDARGFHCLSRARLLDLARGVTPLRSAIVPPEQAEAIIQARRQRGVPVTQLAVPDEGHGLRRPDSIRRAIEAELTFSRTLLVGNQ